MTKTLLNPHYIIIFLIISSILLFCSFKGRNALGHTPTLVAVMHYNAGCQPPLNVTKKKKKEQGKHT